MTTNKLKGYVGGFCISYAYLLKDRVRLQVNACPQITQESLKIRLSYLARECKTPWVFHLLGNIFLNMLYQCLNLLPKAKSSSFIFHLVDFPLHDSFIPRIFVGIGTYVFNDSKHQLVASTSNCLDMQHQG